MHARAAGSPNKLMSLQPQQVRCLWPLGTAPLAAGEVLDADPGVTGLWELELASGQLPETSILNSQLDCCKSSRTIHPPTGTGLPRPRPPQPSPPSAANSQDPTRFKSSSAAQWPELPQVVTTSLDARSSRAMERASSSPRQRPSSGRPPSHCRPFSGQQEARCRNGRSCPLYSW